MVRPRTPEETAADAEAVAKAAEDRATAATNAAQTALQRIGATNAALKRGRLPESRDGLIDALAADLRVPPDKLRRGLKWLSEQQR